MLSLDPRANNISNETSEVALFVYSNIHSRFIIYYKLEILLYTITIITNSLTLIFISCNAKLRTLSNVFFASLAITDFVQGVFGLAFNGMRLYGLSTNTWDFIDLITLELLQFLWWFSTMFSYFCLLMITLERWLFISQPFLHQRIWNRKAVAAFLASTMVLSLIGSCISVTGSLASTNVGYLFPISHTLFSLAIIIAYGHIVLISYRQHRAIEKNISHLRHQSLDNEQPQVMFNNWKAVRMSLTVFVMYFCTVSPWTYFQAFQQFSSDSVDKGEVSQALNSFSCLHFCSNFFVYSFQNKDFYEVLKKCFKRVNCRRNNRIENM